MKNHIYTSDFRQTNPSEENLNKIFNAKTNSQYQDKPYESSEHVNYKASKNPSSIEVLEQNNNFKIPLNSFYYDKGETNAPMLNLNHKNSYMDANNNSIIKSNNFFNMASVASKDIENNEYINLPTNVNKENYYNRYEISNKSIPINDNMKYEINRTHLIHNLDNKLNNLPENLNRRYIVNQEFMNNETNNYKETYNFSNSYNYLHNNLNQTDYNNMTNNYHSALGNNIKNNHSNSLYTNNFSNENDHLLNADNKSFIFNKIPQEKNEREIVIPHHKNMTINKNIANNLEQLQAILCLQKLEEIPAPFLNINEIKYGVSVYFNSYDDIIDKYQSKFYSCKFVDLCTYADCELQNEIITLPFNNEEYIYLKVIESSMYKTEIIGRLQLKVKSLSQEYPLRIPIIGDDGNSKGFLIMNFFITSSYYDIKNEILTEKKSLPNKTRSTRIRRRNNGFHFFENFTKWCCEITDDHVN